MQGAKAYKALRPSNWLFSICAASPKWGELRSLIGLRSWVMRNVSIFSGSAPFVPIYFFNLIDLSLA